MTTISRRQALVGAASAPLAAAPLGVAAASVADASSAVQDSRGLFNPSAYVARGTVFTRSVASMPVASNSSTLAKAMASMPSNYAGRRGVGWLKSSINTESYNIPIYVVDSRVPGCPTRSISVQRLECAGDPVVDGTIPCPTYAQPAWGSDNSLAIYDRGTGILREYFGVEPKGSTWQASTAGYTYTAPDFAGLGSKDPSMQVYKGSSSVVKMHNPLSQIGMGELSAGVINHAVSVTFAEAARGHSWPAKQSDGSLAPGSAPVLGQWFRLPPSLDIDSLNLQPLTRMIAKAVQRYGGYGADHNAWCHAFNLESPFTVPGGRQSSLIDPQLAALGVQMTNGQVNGDVVNDFPWHLTQWAPSGWNSMSQASGFNLPWRYSRSDWSVSYSGSWAYRPAAVLRGHQMEFNGGATRGRSASMVWKRRRFTASKPTAMVISPYVMHRFGPVTVSVILNGKTVATMSTRSPKALRFSTVKGNNDLQIRADVPAATSIGRWNDYVTLSSMTPR